GVGLTAAQVRQQDEREKKDGFLPIDVAGYTAIQKDGKPSDLYAAVWAMGNDRDDSQMHVGTSSVETEEVRSRLVEAELIPRTQNASIACDGLARYSGIWARPPAGITGVMERDQFELIFEQTQADLSDQLLIDIAISGAGKKQSPHEQAQIALQIAEKVLKM